MCLIRSLVLFLLLCSSATLAVSRRSTNKTSLWQTLRGDAPLVIARGGFSGLFPDSSVAAYELAVNSSVPNVILWCDVQLTKDAAGICFPDLRLDNASDIRNIFRNKANTYSVNGVSMQGYYSVDFTLHELARVSLIQGIYSRSERFDHQYRICTVQDVAKNSTTAGLWLNIQHDIFFNQQKLSMRSFVLSITRSVTVTYISSPEVNFLRSILTRKLSTMKLVLRFLNSSEIEPSTNQTYGSLLKNLTFVKTFASGILVPKSYIWPVDIDLYLQPHTSLVLDAHKEGLEVFASDFANDIPFAYNYSYNPMDEYLSFIDNGNFSVDGMVSDFPITTSEAIGCFSHVKNGSGQGKPLVISYQGASGDYPGCTNLAYSRAISDGVDVLDCPVQMTKDGIPICLGVIDLMDSTKVAQSAYINYTMRIPELKPGNGIFTFSLTWSQIQKLTPEISNPYTDATLYRNPKSKNDGKFMTLSDFLALTKNTSSLSGILITVENAAYLAEKQGLMVTDAVLNALSEAGYNNQTVKKVMIQSINSSVLIKFKEKSNYELVYNVDETIRDALNSTILDIKKFADSVVVSKASVFPDHEKYLTDSTNVVAKLQAFDLPVYVQLFRNEFLSQAWDFLSDAIVEINSFVIGAGIDGVISDFPGTAVKYKRNRCLGLGKKAPNYMLPAQPGDLMEVIDPQMRPPADAPNPVLTDSDVSEPPLASAVQNNRTSNTAGGPTAVAPGPSNGQQRVVACSYLYNLAILLVTLLLQ